MKVYVSQIYISPGVNFDFTHHFQKLLSEELSAMVAQTGGFMRKYGPEFDLIFNMSAKKEIHENEIRGPSVYKKDKDVEFTIFLPFDVIGASTDRYRVALKFLLDGIRTVFDKLGIDSAKLEERKESIIERICSDSTMFEPALKSPGRGIHD